jgi:carboxylate-amine ligase
MVPRAVTAKRSTQPAADAETLRALFDHDRPPTFGIEEEAMALDPETLDLAPCAPELLEADGGHERLKLELPASQLEAISLPCATLTELGEELLSGRRRLAAAAGDRARPASAGAHPFAAAEGALNRGGRYDRTEREYGPVARRQLVCGLHVHVALSGPERVLAVYNALRGHLPDLAALAANAPLREGRPAGMASVRPLIAGMLPRQGVPPSYGGWEQLAADLAWGNATGRLEGFAGWWWELRIHPLLGTVELRVPDAQSTPQDAMAVAASAVALVLYLAERHDAGELPAPAPSWRIAENRWSAARHGTDGETADLTSGAMTATRERLHGLLDELRPTAAALGGGEQIDHAHALAECNGAQRQLAVARERGPHGVADWLCQAFLAARAAV